MQVLEFKNVTRTFGPTSVLSSVSHGWPVGAVHFITGENGAGKSTLLRLATGLLTPTTGAISINGSDPTPSLFSYLPPGSSAWYPELTAMENLGFFGQLQGLSHLEIQQRSKTLSNLVELRPELADPLSNYSSGALQRLSLMRTFLASRPFYFLDEPERHLDPAGLRALESLCRDRATSGAGILIATTSIPAGWATTHPLHIENGRLVSR